MDPCKASPMSPPAFDITPKREASMLHFLYRQLFVKPVPLTRRDVDLSGKTAIVTGANTGLGLEAARQLLDLGLTKLILAVRSISKGEAARNNLCLARPQKDFEIDVWHLDLESYDSITRLAEQADALKRLDIVILNAGLFKGTEEFHPSTGFEMDVQINYVSNALLAILLMPALRKASMTELGRLVFVSSETASWVPFPERSSSSILRTFREKSHPWDYAVRYGTSKLLGQLFVQELAKHVSSTALVVNAVNPGFCYGTELQREGEGTVVGFIVRCFTSLIGRSCHAGAVTIVQAATQFGTEVHGHYVGDGKIKPKAPVVYQPEGEQAAKRLWEETMAELSFAGVEEIIATMGK